jgi:hypothetical protein
MGRWKKSAKTYTHYKGLVEGNSRQVHIGCFVITDGFKIKIAALGF